MVEIIIGCYGAMLGMLVALEQWVALAVFVLGFMLGLVYGRKNK